MNDGELIARADANYFDSMRLLVPTLDSGEVRERNGLLISASGLPVAFLNVALITRPLDKPEEVLRQAVDYFDERRLPFIVRVREGVDQASERAAEALGLPYRDTTPGMVLHPLPEMPAPPSALDIRLVNDEPSLAKYAETVALGFGMPAEFGRAFITPRWLELPDCLLYLGYADGRPVATSALIASRRVAGVYNVATLPDARKRGFGEAMTWHAVREGAQAGCVMSSLQASQMGMPVYARMGFRAVAPYRTFVRPEM